MSKKTRLAALLLSATFLTAPALSSVAYANEHGDWNKSAQGSECEHSQLSEAQRKLLHDTMHRLHEDNKQTFEDMRKLHESLHQVLVAKNFDKAAFISITAQIETKRTQLETSRAQAFASIADQFTPEERHHLAHMFGHRHHGHGHHHGDRHEGWHHHE